jgi:hypothetical protein
VTDRVRLSGFDKMQNRVNVVGGVWGNENEHHCHGERKRNYSVNLSYAQHAESSNTHSDD